MLYSIPHHKKFYTWHVLKFLENLQQLYNHPTAFRRNVSTDDSRNFRSAISPIFLIRSSRCLNDAKQACRVWRR